MHMSTFEIVTVLYMICVLITAYRAVGVLYHLYRAVSPFCHRLLYLVSHDMTMVVTVRKNVLALTSVCLPEEIHATNFLSQS